MLYNNLDTFMLYNNLDTISNKREKIDNSRSNAREKKEKVDLRDGN